MAGKMQLGEKATEAMAGRIEAAPGQPLAKNIVCTVCDNPAFENPVKTAVCAHLFHKECLEQWLKDKQGDAHSCPFCRQVLPAGGAYTEADRYVRAILAELEVDCPQDCAAPNPKRMRYEQLAGHIRACPLTPMRCGNPGCEEVAPQKDAQAHAAKCEHRAVSCSLCSGKVKKGELQGHKANECPRRRYMCAYCHRKNLIYSNKAAHEREDCTGQVPIAWVADLRQQNEELREQNRKLQQTLLASLCSSIEVESKEKEYSNGKYTITPEQVNGCCVWTRAPSYSVYKCRNGFWAVTSKREFMDRNVGWLRSAEKSDAPHPTAVSAWKVAAGQRKGWDPAPGTTVSVATPP